MAMTPEIKDRLTRFTLAAKAVIYDAGRMQQFMQMMGDKDGAITAVKTVMGTIDTKIPIPADLAPLLGVNIYMMLVDVAREITGKKPSPEIVRDVIWKILKGIQPSGQPQQPQQPAQPAQRPGLIQQAQQPMEA